MSAEAFRKVWASYMCVWLLFWILQHLGKFKNTLTCYLPNSIIYIAMCRLRERETQKVSFSHEAK